MHADVGIRDERIVRVAAGLEPGRLEIDASGKLVLPGAIDAHCHVAQKSSTGLMTADDFLTATRSAACGGTTTIIPFAAQHRGDSLRDVVREYHVRAETAIIDYGFHLIASDANRRTLDEDLPELIREGCTSFKVFMTYDALKLTDGQILDVLAVVWADGELRGRPGRGVFLRRRPFTMSQIPADSRSLAAAGPDVRVAKGIVESETPRSRGGRR